MIVPPDISVLICNYLYKIANPKTWDSCWKGSDSSQSVRNYINHHGGETMCFRDWIDNYDSMGDKEFGHYNASILFDYNVTLGDCKDELNQKTMVRMIYAECRKHLGLYKCHWTCI